MRKVKNKEVIRRLSDKSFKVNKTRNLIAVVAIALTSMLFSALFSVGIGTVYTFQRQTARQSGGDAHGVFKELTQEEYEKLKVHPLIKESMPCRLVADYVRNPEFLKRHAEAWYYPEEAYPHCFIDIIEGKAPKAADEILLDETSMELLGLPKESGQKVTLDLQLHNYDETITERTFTVSGVIKSDPALDVGFALVSEAYVEKYAQELSYKGQDDTGSTMGSIRMDVIFSNSLGIQKKLDQVLTESGFSTEPGADNYIACNANWAYVSDGADADPTTVGAVAGALVLILITGYLIIYNIFRISIMKDIRYYGLLKTIGTTGRQIKKIIRRQALKLSAIGIPIGLLAGFFVGKALLPAILNSTGTVAQGETHIPVSPWIFIGAAVFSLITVFISTGHPAKMAAKVSPIEALRFTEGKKAKKKGKRSSGGGKIWRMAFTAFTSHLSVLNPYNSV
jgi:putative ABC transport system permease protein